ncbi:MAG: hypothetical protein RJB01_336 [Actinomycetota bacterium]
MFGRFPRTSLTAAGTLSLGAGLVFGMLVPASATDDSPEMVIAAEVAPIDAVESLQPESTEAATPAVEVVPAEITALAAEGPRPTKYRKPKAATRTKKAKHVPDRPLDGGEGRRIVYDKTLMHVWLMDKNDEVVARYPVVGRWDRPVLGEYKIYSQSPKSGNPNSEVTFDHMTRFAYGLDGKTPIGFHSIPKYYDGRMMHSTDQLGLPVATGGCVRMAAEDAEFLYNWAKKGDRVIVLPSPD